MKRKGIRSPLGSGTRTSRANSAAPKATVGPGGRQFAKRFCSVTRTGAQCPVSRLNKGKAYKWTTSTRSDSVDATACPTCGRRISLVTPTLTSRAAHVRDLSDVQGDTKMPAHTRKEKKKQPKGSFKMPKKKGKKKKRR